MLLGGLSGSRNRGIVESWNRSKTVSQGFYFILHCCRTRARARRSSRRRRRRRSGRRWPRPRTIARSRRPSQRRSRRARGAAGSRGVLLRGGAPFGAAASAAGARGVASGGGGGGGGGGGRGRGRGSGSGSGSGAGVGGVGARGGAVGARVVLVGSLRGSAQPCARHLGPTRQCCQWPARRIAPPPGHTPYRSCGAWPVAWPARHSADTVCYSSRAIKDAADEDDTTTRGSLERLGVLHSVLVTSTWCV